MQTTSELIIEASRAGYSRELIAVMLDTTLDFVNEVLDNV